MHRVAQTSLCAVLLGGWRLNIKITSLRITTTTRLREDTDIPFADGLTIFGGPNGGGKSNLLAILNIILRGNFWKSLEIVDGKTFKGPFN